MREQWLIEYKSSVVDDVQCDAQCLQCHRVEAWSNDYAFFGHKTNLGKLTLLVPRELVKAVRMLYDHAGEEVTGTQNIDSSVCCGDMNESEWELEKTKAGI